MRPSELLALRWSALDLEPGTLSVTDAFPSVMDRRFEGPPKSRAGTRALKLDPALVTVLRTHHTRQIERRVLLGP